MIPRDPRPAMTAIWSDANRYRIWFEIEALATEAMAGSTVPAEAARTVRENGAKMLAAISDADIERIAAIERGPATTSLPS